MTTHLDRLLFTQGGQCFFCRKALLKQHQKPNTDAEVGNLIAELQRRGKVIVTDTKVTYKLG